MSTHKIKIASILISAIIVLSVAPIYASSSNDPQWPQQGYDPQQSGQSPSLGPQKNNSKWNYSIEQGTSSQIENSPVVDSEGNIYFVGSHTNDEGLDHSPPVNNLYAILPNGTLKWNVTLPVDYQISPISIGSDGTLYVAGSTAWPNMAGYLFAFNSNGVLLWNFTDPIFKKTPQFMAPVVMSDGTIYIAGNRMPPICDNGVYWALFNNGTPKWNFTPSPTRNKIKGYAVDKNGISYLGVEQESAALGISNADDGVVYAVYPNGTQQWSLNLDLPTMEDTTRRVESILPAIGPNGMIYLMVQAMFNPPLLLQATEENPNPPTIVKNFVFAVNPSGTQEWRYDLPENTLETSNLAISSDGIIYFSGLIGGLLGVNPIQSGGTLFALYPNGTQKWNKTPNSIGLSTPIIGTDGTIYTANSGPRGENGQGGGGGKSDLIEGFGTDFQEFTPEPIVNAMLFAFNPDGTIKWTINNTASNFAAAIAKDGTMYLSGTRPKEITPIEEANTEPINEGVLYAIQGQTSNLYLQVKSSNNNPTVGDIITLTFKVGNTAQDSGIGTIFTWVLPAGLEIVGNPWSDTVNQPVYDPATRTITWEIGEVPYGDPNLWANTRVLAAGIIKIQSMLSTLTYDPNIVQNLQILSIDARIPQTVSASTSAATSIKTVGMQSTGLPLVVLLVAILTILGGFWTAKRK